jgi:hypothetical protein
MTEVAHLIDQETLPLGRVVHLGSVFRNKGIEKGIEPFIIPSLRSQNTS